MARLAAPAARVLQPAPGALLALALACSAVALIIWRFRHAAGAAREAALLAHLWSPHRATLIIGLTFVALTVVAGAWTYTDWLEALGRGGMRADATQATLFVALLGGAILGGATTGRLGHRRPDRRALARCLAGGFAMGVGGLLVPGGNDGLILVGLPLLHPHALVGLAAMALTIAAGLVLERSRASLRRAGTPA